MSDEGNDGEVTAEAVTREYECEVSGTVYGTVTVEAADEAEARQKAKDTFSHLVEWDTYSGNIFIDMVESAKAVEA